ncbi:MAG TPA: hypothetical protein VJS44_08630 [Pyrinomonadaceae bacterium]|nr:hypothetical protein [Pyrinomonadaceae bacterium]
MAWLWSSWEEYIDNVAPVTIKSFGLFNLAHLGSWFETEEKLFEAVSKLTTSIESLNGLGFVEDDDMPFVDDTETIEKAKDVVYDLIRAGEELLLYNKRLVKNGAAYGFLHQHELLEHWERYSASDRISLEIEQLITDTKELLKGYYQLKESDGQFLTFELGLPPELEADFRLARNLFSMGFDEVGVLISGRGLEGVLRKIAQVRKIMIDVKGRVEPASDADIYDLIELMFRLRWKITKHRLITTEVRALLHYLRALRNSGAHSSPEGKRATIGPREIAAVMAETANQLWKEVSGTRAKFEQTTIQKNW